MKNLNFLSEEGNPDYYINWYDRIVEPKNNPGKSVLIKIRNTIKADYTDYESKFNSKSLLEVQTNNSFENEEKDFLKSCYNTDTIEKLSLITSIRNLQSNEVKGLCQYCGLNSPDTIDHFFPKGEFPEYSVLAINLLPCCAKCNLKKGEKYKIEKKGEAYLSTINFYIDRFIERKFLYVNIEYNEGIPRVEFFLRNDMKIGRNCFEIIENHFDRLDLLERYNSQANVEISEIDRQLRAYYPQKISKKKLQKVLRTYCENVARDFGINHWKYVLRFALLENEEFIDSYSKGSFLSKFSLKSSRER